MNKQKLLGVIAPAVIFIALISYALYLLVGIYPDVLFTAQDRNMYAGDSMYFSELVARPFGLFQYIGGFLTQFFYYPALGAAMLVAIWAAIVVVGIKAFELKGIWRSLMIVPAACLLASELDLGYWVYCLNIPGYWFSQSVALLCVLLLIWAANATPKRFHIVWYALIGFAAFPIFGWFSYLFAVCLAFSQLSKGLKSSWIGGVGIALAAIAPLVFNTLRYEGIGLDKVFQAGFPIFNTSTDESLRPSIPFFILAGITVFASLGRLLPDVKRLPAAVAYLVVGIAASAYVWDTKFHDDNYLYEMQMIKATMNDDWRGVISVAENTKTPSRAMVMLKNIALMNTGELGERSYELGNSGKEINDPDSLNINIMHIASAPIYYNYGKINYSMRWCMEFAVVYGFSPYHLKNLARCAEASGEKELMRKYTDRMHRLVFYKDWQPAPTTKVVKELQTLFKDALDSDENNCERYIISMFSRSYNENSALMRELTLFYSTIMRDASLFCPAFYDYAKAYDGDYLPASYEQAYCMFVQRFPDRFPYRVKITDKTIGDFKQFMSDGNEYAKYAGTEEAVAKMMFDRWSDTYWWFNAFGRSKY